MSVDDVVAHSLKNWPLLLQTRLDVLHRVFSWTGVGMTGTEWRASVLDKPQTMVPYQPYTVEYACPEPLDELPDPHTRGWSVARIQLLPVSKQDREWLYGIKKVPRDQLRADWRAALLEYYMGLLAHPNVHPISREFEAHQIALLT